MTKIDIVSGFLGAGKTTLIKKLLKEALAGTKVVLIENEFGEIGIDGGFLKESGIEIREMNAGCICCSLVGDFGTSLREVMETYAPERILIEPSGVGKLSDVMRAINDASEHTQMHLNSAVAVVDAAKCKVYLKNFGEFFDNQIAYAGTIILSRTDKISAEKIDECVELLRAINKDATIITTPIAQLDGRMILDTIEGTTDLQKQILEAYLAFGRGGQNNDVRAKTCLEASQTPPERSDDYGTAKHGKRQQHGKDHQDGRTAGFSGQISHGQPLHAHPSFLMDNFPFFMAVRPF